MNKLLLTICFLFLINFVYAEQNIPSYCTSVPGTPVCKTGEHLEKQIFNSNPSQCVYGYVCVSGNVLDVNSSTTINKIKTNTFVDNCPTSLTFTLKKGSVDLKTNNEVSLVQKFLKKNLILSDNVFLVTGIYGGVTERFVKKFQKQNGILETGVVGNITRNKITSLCTGVVCNSECANPPVGCTYRNIPENHCGCGDLVCGNQNQW